jgi:hypothetical protein
MPVMRLLDPGPPDTNADRGIHKVATPFWSVCGDDALVILDTVRQCLSTLRVNAAASVVQGYSFTFLARPDGDVELNNVVYFTPTINDGSPLARLGKLFQQYQAPSYGIFRTPVLQRIFDALQPMTTVLARELLWSALAVIEGQFIRLHNFSYGRSMGPSAAYECWHPLEWFCKDPDRLFAEYLRYRESLAAAVIQHPDNTQELDEVRDVLDIIHLRYLARHAPDSVLGFVAEQQMKGVDFAEYWPRYEVHLPLYEAAGIRTSPLSETLPPVSVRSHARSYLLSPSFYAPRGTEAFHMNDIVRLLGTLDRYRPALQDNHATTSGN